MIVQRAWLPRFCIAIFLTLIGVCQACSAQQSSANTQRQRTAVEAEMKSAIEAVQRIVNQPVASFARTAEMNVSTYRPGWFHDGAIKPDFDNVDVRRTRETSYDGKEFVTSDLNPGVVFHGDDAVVNCSCPGKSFQRVGKYDIILLLQVMQKTILYLFCFSICIKVRRRDLARG